jgi:aconitate hydratase
MNSFGSKSTLTVGGNKFDYHSLERAEQAGAGAIARMPFSLKVMLENLLRFEDGLTVSKEDILALARSGGTPPQDKEIAFRPARVLMQDFTGVPAVVDLATMRDVIKQMGGDPKKINPLQQVDLVIDHSVQVDQFGTPEAFAFNADRELERNRERYIFLKWGQKAFRNFRVVPPDVGIVHQVNIEYLAPVVYSGTMNGSMCAYPDTVVGTDSHTTMVNGLGVVGWGVGGIEAEGAMLGQPLSMLIPQVVGFKLHGRLREGVTATDAVLTVTQILRKKGVVGKFVEFFGAGVASLSLADRATIANMAPEYGATIGFFPIDDETLNYMKLTGRKPEQIALVEAYTKSQGLFRTATSADPVFTDSIELDLSTVEPSMAGPKRPQDRVPRWRNPSRYFRDALPSLMKSQSAGKVAVATNGNRLRLGTVGCNCGDHELHQHIRNPSVMIAAGLCQKGCRTGNAGKAVGEDQPGSGSRVVTRLPAAPPAFCPILEKLRFPCCRLRLHDCIGNSGPLPDAVSKAVKGRLAGRRFRAQRQPELSKDESILRFEPTTSLRPRWSLRMRSPSCGYGPHDRTPYGTDSGGQPSI